MAEESSVKYRLIEFLKKKRITQSEFCRELGVAPTYIGAMRKGLSLDKLRKVCDMFPDLNRDWLQYGEGEMLKPEKEDDTIISKEYETLLLPVEAFAGGLQMWSQGVRRNDCRKIVSPISGADFAIPIKGDSMEPRFHDGSTLLIKQINEKSFIPWGHPMVVDTENGVLVKNLMPDDDPKDGGEYVIAESLNPKYPPFKIPISSIFGLYRIMGTIEIYPNI